jgi:putative addiction module killer protein
MVEIIRSNIFDRWLDDLKDRRGRARIEARIRRMNLGNPGEVKPLGPISEMKIDYGPGYRVYFMQRGPFAAVLLCGGDKDSQHKDIPLAKAIAKQWKDMK